MLGSTIDSLGKFSKAQMAGWHITPILALVGVSCLWKPLFPFPGLSQWNHLIFPCVLVCNHNSGNSNILFPSPLSWLAFLTKSFLRQHLFYSIQNTEQQWMGHWPHLGLPSFCQNPHMQITLILIGNLELACLSCQVWVIMLSRNSAAHIKSTTLSAQVNGTHRTGAGQQGWVNVSQWHQDEPSLKKGDY